jgi:hypothetical protein
MKKCFVASPIGKPGTEIRKHADWVLNGIVRQVVTPLGYAVRRGDEIAEPGVITHQVIAALVNDDLVVADLTALNPNVFYELALRQALMRPVIMIARQGTEVPFDVRTGRVIYFDQAVYESIEKARMDVAKAVWAIESPGFQSMDNVALSFQSLGVSLVTRDDPPVTLSPVEPDNMQSSNMVDAAPDPPAAEKVIASAKDGVTIKGLFDQIHEALEKKS